MSNPIINSLTVVAIGAACAACTNRGVYEATESLRLEDCRDIVTHEEREACEDKARMSYAEYEALIVNQDFAGALEDLCALFLAPRLALAAQQARHATLIRALLD